MMIYGNTTSKFKPKQKTKAEREEYDAWCNKHGIKAVGKTKKKTVRVLNSPVLVTNPIRRETKYYPSLDTGHTGAVNMGKQKQVYTGDKIIGIATMHKSNLVPIFNDESAVEVSRMRR